jgi:hypothetical protein
MSKLQVNIEIFDPVTPFNTYKVNNHDLDAWRDITVITKNLRELLPQVKEIRTQQLDLLGGIIIKVPIVEIGIKIGSIVFHSIEVAVVDDGEYDLWLGGNELQGCFDIGRIGKGGNVDVVTPWKEDPESLSLEIFPVTMPFNQINLERYLCSLRQIYNMCLISEHEINIVDIDDIEALVDHDIGVTEANRLKISWVDSGSIFIGLKSATLKTLKRISKIFNISASAKLAQQLADSKKAENDAILAQETRDATALRIIEEQERYKIENVKKSYDIWRREAKSRIKFLDDMIQSVEDKNIAKQLREKKDQAILTLTEQELLPMVQNIPKPREALESVLALPSST